MENRLFDRTLTIADFFNVFAKRAWIIVLAVIIGASSTVALEIFRTKNEADEYEAEVILRLPQSGNVTDGSSTELSLINDFYRIIDTSLVLNPVYESMDFSGEEKEITYDDFRKQISIIQHPNSRIIKIQVQWTDADTAQRIADCICTEGLEKIEGSLADNEMGAMIKRIESETRKLIPSSSGESTLKKALIIGMGCGVAVYLLFVIIFWLDNKVREDDDLESSIGITVIGKVPNEKLACKMTGGHYGQMLLGKMKNKKSEENK